MREREAKGPTGEALGAKPEWSEGEPCSFVPPGLSHLETWFFL